MEQPPGYVAQGENTVWRLRKVIYGLKQSPRAWFEKFSIVISDIEFSRCHSDHSVFVHHAKIGSVILTVYVDDILLIKSDWSVTDIYIVTFSYLLYNKSCYLVLFLFNNVQAQY